MQPQAQRPRNELPLFMVGGNKFGRFPKMSDEQTFNMVVTDGFLAPYAGYKKVFQINKTQTVGRTIFASTRGDFMVAVIGNTVYKVQGPTSNLIVYALFNLNTFTGDVFIDENNASQIAIADGQALWIYNWETGDIVQAVLPLNTETGLPIKPGYVTFHDTYFIVPDLESSFWYLSAPNDGLNWFWGAGSIPVNGAIQTKPDNSVAIIRAPGKGSLIYVFGNNVTEMWTDVGSQSFPYAKSTSVSIDFGCVSPSTIAAMEDQVVFLGVNERSGPVIIACTGANVQKISTDGIDYRLEQIKHPDESYAFFYTEAGHIFYQLTFVNPEDNLTLVYDFNKNLFYTLTDEKYNHHIAAKLAYFNQTYYFVSLNDASLYELSYRYTNYDYTMPSILVPNPNVPDIKMIPRVRVCPPMRMDDSSRFVSTNLSFTMEQGVDPYFKQRKLFFLTTEDGIVLTQETNIGFVGKAISNEAILNQYVPRIDMNVSRDGAESFTGYSGVDLDPLGKRKNRVMFNQLGEANDLVCKFNFWSLDRVVVANGVMSIRENKPGPDMK